jgi:hypothetical protein
MEGLKGGILIVMVYYCQALNILTVYRGESSLVSGGASKERASSTKLLALDSSREGMHYEKRREEFTQDIEEEQSRR